MARLQQRKQQGQQQLLANATTSVKRHLVWVSDLDAVSAGTDCEASLKVEKS